MSADTVQISGLSAEQQLEALHRLWDEQQTIWDNVRASFTARLSAMSTENNLLGVELRNIVAERDALLAAPSKLFQPRLVDGDARQAERAAFAAGLHHANVLQRRTTANKQAEAA
jgi:hypothetical protein